jgi:hypothetical protein
MPLPPFQRYPLPGTSSIFVYDRILIRDVQMPLGGPIEGGIELAIEKRKAPGADYSTYVSHGIDATPIRIKLLLFRDIVSGADWFANYDKIRDSLISRQLSKRNSIPVSHPFLNLEGINQIVFTKRSLPTQMFGHIFMVQLEGYNPAQLRVGGSGRGGSSGRVQQDTTLTSNASAVDAQGKSKVVANDKQNTASPTGRPVRANYQGPTQTTVAGKGFSPTQQRARGG